MSKKPRDRGGKDTGHKRRLEASSRDWRAELEERERTVIRSEEGRRRKVHRDSFPTRIMDCVDRMFTRSYARRVMVGHSKTTGGDVTWAARRFVRLARSYRTWLGLNGLQYSRPERTGYWADFAFAAVERAVSGEQVHEEEERVRAGFEEAFAGGECEEGRWLPGHQLSVSDDASSGFGPVYVLGKRMWLDLFLATEEVAKAAGPGWLHTFLDRRKKSVEGVDETRVDLSPADTEREDLIAAGQLPESQRPESEVPTPTNMFVCHGGAWTITFQDTTILLPDRVGLRRIQVLLAHPYDAVSVLDLLDRKTDFRGDVAEDPRARRETSGRVDELREVIEDGDDPVAAASAKEELEGIKAYRASSTGIHSRHRLLGNDRKKAANAAGKSINQAIALIAEKGLPELATHLRSFIQGRTSVDPVYQPPGAVTWVLPPQK